MSSVSQVPPKEKDYTGASDWDSGYKNTSFYSFTANSVQPVFIKSLNTKGVIIRIACLAGGPLALVVDKYSTPIGWNNGGGPILLSTATGVAIVQDTFIPAGVGVWVVSQAAAGMASVTFEFLP